jgi:hypothetical protein
MFNCTRRPRAAGDAGGWFDVWSGSHGSRIEGSEVESAGADCECGITSGKTERWEVHCNERMASHSCREVDWLGYGLDDGRS